MQNLNLLKSHFYLLVIHHIVTADDSLQYNVDSGNSWNGNWFPYEPGITKDNNPELEIRKNLYDTQHGVVMGVEDADCDDGKSNLRMDWYLDPVNFTCFDFNRRFNYQPRSDVRAVLSCDYIPKGYSAPHKCMNEPIEYDRVIPTYGTHRPLWAKWGEYTFLPRQRWIHNLEHGSVVMLYHPCADQNEVNILKVLVKKCLYRHIITPYNLLPPERPLALVAWSCRLEMSKVSPDVVLSFIKERALRGPEQTARDGQYSFMLKQHADILNNDINDKHLCKLYDFMQ